MSRDPWTCSTNKFIKEKMSRKQAVSQKETSGVKSVKSGRGGDRIHWRMREMKT